MKGLSILIPILSIISVFLLYSTFESAKTTTSVKIINFEKKPILSPYEEINIKWLPDQNFKKYRIYLKEIETKNKEMVAEVSGHANSFTISPIHRDFGESPLRIIVEGHNNGQILRLARSKPFFITNLKTININRKKQGLENKLKISRNLPERLSEKRKAIIDEIVKERPPSTLLFPEVEFHSYKDILEFIPKSAFYVLFMPFPGLYPLDNMGKLLASVENIFLLLLTIIAIVGVFVAQKDIRHHLLLGSFVLFIVIHSFSDIDLGSAMRHKAVYFPILLIYSSFIITKYFYKNS